MHTLGLRGRSLVSDRSIRTDYTTLPSRRLRGTRRATSPCAGEVFLVFHNSEFRFFLSQRLPVLVVMLEVMSRITPAMEGSDFKSSSTLRMEERTVA